MVTSALFLHHLSIFPRTQFGISTYYSLPLLHQKPAMSPYKFPLLKLPRVALNEVLKLFTPFEIISLSLCSNYTKSICKTIRAVTHCKETLTKFDVFIDSHYEIHLQFSYLPAHDWVFYMRKKRPVPESTRDRRFVDNVREFFRGEKRILKFFGSKKSRKQKLQEYVSSWDPRRRVVEHCTGGRGTITTTEYALRLRTSDCLISATRNLCFYISEIFHHEIQAFAFDYKMFGIEENQLILELFCQQPVQQFQLSGDTSNDSSKNDILTEILTQQKAINRLNLRFNPSVDYRFDLNQFENRSDSLNILHSHWITFQQLQEIKSQMVFLSRSNFLQADFKVLIQKWRDGWSPNWEALMIEFNEDINIDKCVEGQFIQLQTKDWKNKKAVYR
ncbi:hypothetical protein GCK72_020441 [Caenorhabditis remanei]|uniref:F-box domain-containing protein n=1 Tax=Caenorhabditis remanei TaxID=31234 RepID=A0A6A5GGK2_CAERE|nr:hypothetical protein GCK72_020441 [Caenorhabditis remanei]KAF1753884.1 hypothetical protein GCK72_020441 [Caenorhabditis remanei]